MRRSLFASCFALAFLSQTLWSQSQYIYIAPSDATSQSVTVTLVDPLAVVQAIPAPAQLVNVITAPSGTKVFFISRLPTDTVVIVQGTPPSQTVAQRFDFLEGANAAALSPDGRRLVVATGRGVAILDAVNNSVVVQPGIIDVGFAPNSIAFSLDGRRAFVGSTNSERVTAIDLTTNTAAGSVNVSNLIGIAAAPNGLLYASARNAFVEIDPRSMTVRNTITLVGQPGLLQFTPDGRAGVALNQGGDSVRVYYLDLNARTVSGLGGAVRLRQLVLADNTRAYAVGDDGKLYLVPVGSTGIAIEQSFPSGPSLGGLTGLAGSGEVQPRFLFAVAGTNLYRFDLLYGTIVPLGSVSFTIPGGQIFYSGPTIFGAPTTVLAYNLTQSVPQGQSPLPLVLRVVDAASRPVSNLSVTFTTSATGVTLSDTTLTTNNLGYAVVNVSLPSTLAVGTTIPVTATLASGQQVNYSITITQPPSGGGGGGGGGGGLAGLRILSGQGLVLGVNQPNPPTEPLAVQLTDAAGNPVAGATVTWTLRSGGGTVMPSSTTDAQGIATASFIASSFVQPGLPFEQSTIEAAGGGFSTQFYATSLPPQPITNLPGELQVIIEQPTDRVLSVQAGTPSATPLRVRVASLAGLLQQAIPNVALRFLNPDPLNPIAQCQGPDGIALSDATGLISCSVIGKQLGTFPMTVRIGGVRDFPFTLIVAPGPPSQIRIVQGNNQSGAPGQRLPQGLVAEIRDAAGNLLANVPVTWQVISGTATLQNVVATSDFNGRVSANVLLGSSPGPVSIRLTAGSVSVTFNLTVAVAVGSITKVQGDNQTAVVGQPFPTALGVLVRDPSGQPVSGITVNFSTSGPAVITSSSTPVTNASGVASVNVSAGVAAGTATVTAIAGGQSVTFTLTVIPPGPVITAANIVNGASFQPGISPCSIAVLRGSGIAPGINGVITPQTLVGPLPTRLANVEVTFNGFLAPIYSVSNQGGQEQVAVQVPCELSPGNATVVVRVGSGSTTISNVPIELARPGIFEFTDASGRRYAVAVRPDGSFVNSSNPARRGETIFAFVTGLGQTIPPLATNRVGLPIQLVQLPVVVGLNNQGIRLISAQALPGAVGIYVVAFEVPEDATTGPDRPFAVALQLPGRSELVFGNGSQLPIQ